MFDTAKMGWREVEKAGRQGHSKMQHVERENEGMAPERGTALCWKKQTPEFLSQFVPVGEPQQVGP